MSDVKVSVEKTKIYAVKTDLLVIGLFEKEKPYSDIGEIDLKLKGEISSMIKNKQFTGEFKEMQSISSLGKLGARKVLIVGLGKKDKFNLEAIRKLGGVVSSAAKSIKAKDFVSDIHNVKLKPKENDSLKAQAFTEGALLGLYSFSKYKKDDKEKSKLDVKEIKLLSSSDNIKKAIKQAEITSNAVLFARDLVNEPPSSATPSYLAQEAKKLTKKGLKVTVFGKKEILKKGMGALYAVSKGSSEEPKLVIMEYKPSAKKKIAFVGKGITFDSGGMNLKPTNYIEDMKSDMGGAAAVIATMKAVAELKPSVGVIGVVSCAENMVGAAAYKPGDILTAYNKKTIEIQNTDAEGRLVLADGLSYVDKNYKPAAMMSVATLTGAVVVCFGHEASALIGNNEKLVSQVKKASEISGERVWELPLWDEYREAMKGEISDLRNVRTGKGYEGGTITAAAFLENFVGKTPWAHIDIAGTAFLQEPGEYSAKGATGVSTRLLISLVEEWK